MFYRLVIFFDVFFIIYYLFNNYYELLIKIYSIIQKINLDFIVQSIVVFINETNFCKPNYIDMFWIINILIFYCYIIKRKENVFRYGCIYDGMSFTFSFYKLFFINLNTIITVIVLLYQIFYLNKLMPTISSTYKNDKYGIVIIYFLLVLIEMLFYIMENIKTTIKHIPDRNNNNLILKDFFNIDLFDWKNIINTMISKFGNTLIILFVFKFNTGDYLTYYLIHMFFVILLFLNHSHYIYMTNQQYRLVFKMDILALFLFNLFQYSNNGFFVFFFINL